MNHRSQECAGGSLQQQRRSNTGVLGDGEDGLAIPSFSMEANGYLGTRLTLT